MRFRKPLIDFSIPRDMTWFMWLVSEQCRRAIDDLNRDFNRLVYGR